MFGSFIEFLRHSKKTVLLIVVVASITTILTTTISILLSRTDNLTLPSTGTIYTVGIEAYGGDINLTEGTQYIPWGTIQPDTLTNRSFYLRSISNADIKLNISATNWNPPGISGNLTLSWNYTGTPISPEEVIYVTLTLSASGSDSFIIYLVTNNIREFSFDIHIYPSKV